MELDAEMLAAVTLIAAVVVALALRRWFGPSRGSSSFDADGGDSGDGGD